MIKTTHDDATLTGFRNLADAMLGTDRNWEWIGLNMSQRMFGITRERAETYAAQYGGVARVDTDHCSVSQCLLARGHGGGHRGGPAW